MNTVISLNGKVIVITEKGETFQKEEVTPNEFKALTNPDITDTELYEIMCPEYHERCKQRDKVLALKDAINNSKLLSLKGDSIYWDSISEISLPQKFVEAVLRAEKEEDEDRLIAYKNFWTLCGLNPDERCRKNLFWFLDRNDYVISKCGFFVGYRNVEVHKKLGDGTVIYTDNYTHSFRIKIGEMVTMPREKCDANQDHVCAPALHIGSRDWLKRNYFGNVGLVCLVNPQDVVAVPPVESYGKLRTCAYLPIGIADFDMEGNVIPFNCTDGFDCSYVTKVIYEGLMGTETDSSYKIEIPSVPGIDRKTITDSLLDIAMKAITERQV